MRRYEISDVDWERIAPLLPGKEGDVGRTAGDNRQFINGVLWVARSGALWRETFRSVMVIGILFFYAFVVGQ
jgi:transposase